jgi:hypothetical protein
LNDETMRRDDPDPAPDSTEISDAGPTASSGEAETRTAVDDALVRVPEADERSASDAEDRDDRIELLDQDRSESFRRQWDEIQAAFVDRPRESVQQADGLVVEVVQHLQASFTVARERLESQWSQGDDASTEDLRLTLRRYRSFFDRLLTA